MRDNAPERGSVQTTLATTVRFSGPGLHGGRPCAIAVRPAPADSGIRFRRTDPQAAGTTIPALWTRVEPAPLCTRIGDGEGVSVSTIEHLMAALAGCGIHNALVDVNGPELPILDGSAGPFVEGLAAAGVVPLEAPLRAIRLRAPVEVRDGPAVARLDPLSDPDAPLEIAFSIDFADAAIGRQSLLLSMAGGSFLEQLSDSRTFCRLGDVQAMRARGLARGGSVDNAVVFDGDRVLTPGGLRHPDEPVRHKMLDALGDLALAGAPILARYTGHRAGHALTAALLARLFATPSAWAWEVPSPALRARMPGAGALPVQTLRGRRASTGLRASA